MKRAEAMFEEGDRDGLAVWLRIRTAILQWQAGPAGPLH